MAASDVLEALQAINADIEGVKSALLWMPGFNDSVRLPMTLCYPGPAEHSDASMRHLRTDRTWGIRLYVRPIGTGRGIDEGFQDCLPFLARFYTEYITQEHTANDAWDCLHYVGDSGVILMKMHGNEALTEQYWGIEFTVKTTHYTASTV